VSEPTRLSVPFEPMSARAVRRDFIAHLNPIQ
jgi:hypothetical protein